MKSPLNYKLRLRRTLVVINGFILAVATLLPLMASSASAVQLTSRYATVDTAKPGAATSITFGFTTPSTVAVQSIEIDFCDTAIGNCSSANTPGLPASASPTVTINASWTNATPFLGSAYLLGNVTSGGTNNRMRLTRLQAATETLGAGRTINITGLTNKSTANLTYYPRILLFSDTAYTTQVMEGTTAQSTNQALTINAQVQEVLVFCVGSTPTDSATTQIRNYGNTVNVTSCSAADGVSVNLGAVDSGHINVTPVAITNQGDASLAYAMVQTNGQGGVVIGYRANQDSTYGGKLKVIGQTCSGTTTTDQCFNSQGGTQGVFTAGTENFGMTIAGVNCVNVGTQYNGIACNSTSNTLAQLCPQTNYGYSGAWSCNATHAYDTTAGYIVGPTTSKYAWDDTGASVLPIASSATSTYKIVANEALMIKFAATAQVTTPTGIYAASADFVATPTY